jgi:hypothetical protein
LGDLPVVAILSTLLLIEDDSGFRSGLFKITRGRCSLLDFFTLLLLSLFLLAFRLLSLGHVRLALVVDHGELFTRLCGKTG